MARNYRNNLTPARRFMLQEKLQASELFDGKKQSYPSSYSPFSFIRSFILLGSHLTMWLFL